jgi:16S rRNA (cytosine967-C5)-methyltransferase
MAAKGKGEPVAPGERASSPGRDPLERLRTVPWEALRGLAEPLRETLGRVLGGAPAERALDALLRQHRSLEAARRAALAEAVFGVALWRRRLARAAGLARWEGADPALLLCALLHSLASVPEERARELSGLPAAAPIGWTDGAGWTLADRWSLPDWLAAALERELGAGAEAFARAVCAPGPVCLRANLLRGTREELAASLATDGIATRPGRYAAQALVATSPRPNLLGAAAHREGRFEAQDEGSQLVGALVEARPGDCVLDACAGAGGKALLLAAELRDRGRVVAADVDRERLARLQTRAVRAGASCIEIAAAEAPREAIFDRALVDAPCSELGALRRGPDARWRARPGELEGLPALQLRILEGAARVLRPGGQLVYATCTLRREENEEVALAFEEAHPEFQRTRPGARFLGASFVRGGFFRSLPHLHDCDGFFAAVYRRRGGDADEGAEWHL